MTTDKPKPKSETRNYETAVIVCDGKRIGRLRNVTVRTNHSPVELLATTRT